jgi:hypothetical protein
MTLFRFITMFCQSHDMHIDCNMGVLSRQNTYINLISTRYYMDIHPNPNIIGFVSNLKSSPIILDAQCT